MSDLEERARRLVDAARPGHNPSAADAARVRAALKARVLAEPLLIQPGPAQTRPLTPGLLPPGPVPVAASGAFGKVLIALGVGSALGFAAGLYAASAFWPGMRAQPVETGDVDRAPPAMGAAGTREASPAPARPHAAGRTDDAAPASSVRLDGVEAMAAERVLSTSQGAIQKAKSLPSVPPRVHRRTTSGAPASPAAAVSPLKAELDGLRRAQELLHQGRPAWAIARLDELDRAGVGSVLLEERAATRAIAECRIGADSARQADEYARRFPRSVHLERVRTSCAGATPVGTSVSRGGVLAPKVAPAQTESSGSPHEE
jgi:hypothetical protein